MPTVAIQVRPARNGDWLGVWSIEQTLPHPWDMTQHHEFMIPDRSCTYIAEGDGHVFGFVSVTAMPRYVDVVRIGVDVDQRKIGIGSGLLAGVEHWFCAGKKQKRQMQAVVGERDVAMQLFLRSCGWRWAKTVQWGTVDDEYLFTKDVPK